jgi:hypothetical protein
MDTYVDFFLGALETFRKHGGLVHVGHMEVDFLLVRTYFFGGGVLCILKEDIEH